MGKSHPSPLSEKRDALELVPFPSSRHWQTCSLKSEAAPALAEKTQRIAQPNEEPWRLSFSLCHRSLLYQRGDTSPPFSESRRMQASHERTSAAHRQWCRLSSVASTRQPPGRYLAHMVHQPLALGKLAPSPATVCPQTNGRHQSVHPRRGNAARTRSAPRRASDP